MNRIWDNFALFGKIVTLDHTFSTNPKKETVSPVLFRLIWFFYSFGAVMIRIRSSFLTMLKNWASENLWLLFYVYWEILLEVPWFLHIFGLISTQI